MNGSKERWNAQVARNTKLILRCACLRYFGSSSISIVTIQKGFIPAGLLLTLFSHKNLLSQFASNFKVRNMHHAKTAK
jgi:hypothetical protein